MDKQILGAVRRSDEAEALGLVEPLNLTLERSHDGVFVVDEGGGIYFAGGKVRKSEVCKEEKFFFFWTLAVVCVCVLQWCRAGEKSAAAFFFPP